MKKTVLFLLLVNLVMFVSGQTSNKNTFINKAIILPNHIKLDYIEQGDPSGVAVIFLHGYTDSWHSFEMVMPYLSSSLHAFAITQRGHGNSYKPEGNYDPAAFADDIAAFMKQLKIKSAAIVGHSMGATIIQRFALDYPQLTKAFVLAGAMASFSENQAVVEFSKVVSNLSDPIEPAFVSEFQKSTLANPIDESMLNTYISESLKVPSRIWKAIIESLIKVDYTTALTAINKPALIIWGDKDQIVPQADQDKFLKAIKVSRLIVYTGNGHGLHWEKPKRFTNDVEQFINSLKK